MPSDEDVTLLTPNQSHLDPPSTTKQLPRLSRLTRFISWARQHFRNHTHAWWAWEISAAVVSLMAMLALIIVLTQADQKLQQSWAVAGTQLTLNTVVAAIGTVIRTSLYIVVAGALNQSAWNWFTATESTLKTTQLHGRPLKDFETFGDAASNSWNCLKLLWRTRCRYLISIGAIVMVLTIGFDTFLQQVLSTEQRPHWVKQDDRNLIAADNIPRLQTINTTSWEALNSTQELDFQALQSNWLAYGSSSATLPTCPSDNCIWPVTPTMGICSECDYATPTVQHSSNVSCANITTYSLDDGVQVTILDCGTPGKNRQQTEWKLMVSSAPVLVPSNISRAKLANLYLLGTDLEIDGTKIKIPSLTAYRCSLYFCIQGFQANTSAGLTTQTPTETRSFSFQPAFPWEGWYRGGEFVGIPSELNVKAGDRFKLTSITSINFLDFLAEFLSGSGMGQGDGAGIESEINFGAAGRFWDQRFSLEGIGHLMENYVNGWTSYLRSTSSLPSDLYYAPSVERQLPIIIVRWPWLSYPLFLQTSGLLFLFLTMRETRRRHVLAWKRHRVALLLANLDESLRDQARGGLASRTGLDDRIGETLVQLDFDGEDGIVFRQVEHLPSKEAGHAVRNDGSLQVSIHHQCH